MTLSGPAAWCQGNTGGHKAGKGRNILDPAEVCRLYLDEGLTTVDIGRRFNVSPAAVGYHLKNAGIILAGPARRARPDGTTRRPATAPTAATDGPDDTTPAGHATASPLERARALAAVAARVDTAADLRDVASALGLDDPVTRLAAWALVVRASRQGPPS